MSPKISVMKIGLLGIIKVQQLFGWDEKEPVQTSPPPSRFFSEGGETSVHRLRKSHLKRRWSGTSVSVDGQKQTFYELPGSHMNVIALNKHQRLVSLHKLIQGLFSYLAFIGPLFTTESVFRGILNSTNLIINIK